MDKAKSKILFTSVLGPYGVDSHRSRFKNPMSLLSNQVTRGQKYYTVRLCNRTFSFDLFAVNLNADVAILDFPKEKNLIQAIQSQQWDRIGVSGIVPNFESILDTITLIRKTDKTVSIDVGGHIANDDLVISQMIARVEERFPFEKMKIWAPEFETKVNGEIHSLNQMLQKKNKLGSGITFVKRDGIEYYSKLPGVGLVSTRGRVRAPLVDASFDKKVFGIPIPSTSAGLILPDVGCPMKCEFCATSHKFGGKFVKFLNSAEDIMEVANAHHQRGKTDFFVMSENFSLDTKRALKLLSLMEEQKKPYTYSVFSSANSLVKLGVENIVKLGYNFIWIGLEESTGKTFNKMHGTDLKDLVDNLQNHGVEILGSTILGFEHQKTSDLDNEIQHALRYNCVYNQFMLYMPTPGTGFYDRMKNQGKLLDHFPWTELHGQSVQNWKHPHLGHEELEKKLDGAFELDFVKLGPSLYRMIDVHFRGYCSTRNWQHELVQLRRKNMRSNFPAYVSLLHAMSIDLKKMRHEKKDEIAELKDNMMKEMGMGSRTLSLILGTVVHKALLIEKMRYFGWMKKRKYPNPRPQLTVYCDLKMNVRGTKKINRPGYVEMLECGDSSLHSNYTQDILHS